MNALGLSRAINALGQAATPAPSVLPRLAPSAWSGLQGIDLVVSLEEAEAHYWRAQNARREARPLGRALAALGVLAVAAWLSAKKN